MVFEVINFRNTPSGAGSDGLRFSQLRSITRSNFGQECFGAGIEAFWRRIVDEPDAFPPEFVGAFSAVKPHGPEGEMRPGLSGDDVGAPYCGRDREWRPRMEELNLEASQYGIGVSGGVEQHVALRARIHHEAGNWIIQTDASNAFNSVLRKPMLQQVSACSPALAGFVAKCYGERPASVCFQMDAGERAKARMLPWGATRRHYGTGPVLPAATAGAYEGSGGVRVAGVKAYAYLEDTIASHEISPGTVGVVPFRERELTTRGLHFNPSKTVALAPRDTCPRRKICYF